MPPGFSQRGFVSTYVPSPLAVATGGGGGAFVAFGGDGCSAACGGSPAQATETMGTTRRRRVRIARTRFSTGSGLVAVDVAERAHGELEFLGVVLDRDLDGVLVETVERERERAALRRDEAI